MTITIPTGELVGVLADVLPFACTDADLPHINVDIQRQRGPVETEPLPTLQPEPKLSEVAR